MPQDLDISMVLQEVHTAIFQTNETIIKTYFDDATQDQPTMMSFKYNETTIDIPLIVMNPPNLFSLEELTVGPAGREYRFRKDTNTSQMFNTMFHD